MHNSSLIADEEESRVHPSVCEDGPFVCHDFTRTVPFVSINGPFIGIIDHEAGFTIVELMVTLVVAAILFAVAIPSFKTFIQNSRVTAQSNEVLAHLAMARSEAIKRNAPVVVCPSSAPSAAAPSCTPGGAWEGGWLVFQDATDPVTKKGNNTFAEAEGDILLRIHEQLEGSNTLRPSGVELSDHLTFGPTGVTTMAAADFFKLCDSRGTSYARAIMIEATGRARIARTTQVAFACP